MAIRSERLGNIFLEGEPLRFGADGARAWVLRDLWGETVLEGEGEPELALADDERGYYTFTVETARGQEETSLAVLARHDTAGTAPVETSPFAVCTHFGQVKGDGLSPNPTPRVDPRAVTLIERAGLGGLRDELYWQKIECNPGEFAFPGPYDDYMARASAAGIHPLIILAYGNPHYDKGAAPQSEAALRGYCHYSEALLGRYRDIHEVEVWNEFNGTASRPGISGKPKDYLRMLQAVHETVKRVRPEVRVVGPAGVTLPYGWLEQLFSLGALDYLDAVSVHPYRHPRAPDGPKEGLDVKLGELQDLIRRHNHGQEKPVYLTELGWPSAGEQGVSERQQAQFVVRSAVLALSARVARLYWYELTNKGVEASSQDSFGVLRHPDDPNGGYTPKPAYVALAVLARQLGEATFVSRDDTPQVLRAYHFKRAGQPVRVMWLGATQNPVDKIEVTLETDTPLTVTDMVGRRKTVAPDRGQVTLTITHDPVYLEGRVTRLHMNSDGDSNRDSGGGAAGGQRVARTVRRLLGGRR